MLVRFAEHAESGDAPLASRVRALAEEMERAAHFGGGLGERLMLLLSQRLRALLDTTEETG